MFDLLNRASIIITGTGQAVVDALENGPGGVLKRKLLLAAGVAEAWDECHCGFLVQTNTRTYYSATALSGEPTNTNLTCAVPFVNFDVTLTLLRCASVSSDQSGRPPRESTVLSEAMLDLAERYIVRNTILCRLTELTDVQIDSFGIGEQVGVGPQGACAGSSTVYSFALRNPCPCA